MTSETERRGQVRIMSGPASYVDTRGPNTVPACYLSHRAGRRIRAMRPRRRASRARAR
jgi:hypothetical protein